jgi:putative DNA primase/helicase
MTAAVRSIEGERVKILQPQPDQTDHTDTDATSVEVDRLSALPLDEYDRQRGDSAKRLGIRSSSLDTLVKAKRAISGDGSGAPKQGRAIKLSEPEPWPEQVVGTTMLSEMAAAIRSHVVTSAEAADAIALWAVHTYLMDVNNISPRLAITSPEKGCGKTTLLDVLSRLVYRPLLASNISASSTFRVVEAVQPCLLIDEADTFLPQNEELRGVLNAGHRRGVAVIRCVGDDSTPREFSPWAAAAIAMIGKLPATLEDRSVAIELHRRVPDEPLREFEYDNTPHLNRLARMAVRWAGDNRSAVRAAKPDAIGLYNRQRDNWKPLMAVAEVVGGEWPNRAMAAARSTAPSGGEQSRGVALLTDIKSIFTTRGADRISSAALVEALVAVEGRPWAEYRNGKPISANGLARALGPFRINPGTIRTDAGEKDTAKGYHLRQFDEAFRRYLPQQGDFNRHNVTSLVAQGLAADEQPSQPKTKLRLDTPENSKDSAECDVVTVGLPPLAEDEEEIDL